MRVIDTTNPVNWNHHLNHGLVGWWMDLPRMTPVNRIWDITRPGLGGYEGTLTSMAVPGTSTSGWRAGLNGFRSLALDGTNDNVPLGVSFLNSTGSIVLALTITTATDDLTVYAAQTSDAFMGVGWQGNLFYLGTSETTTLRNSGRPDAGDTLHIVGTWDGVNIRSFVNGVLQSTTACVNAPVNNGGFPFTLGCFNYGDGDIFFTGGYYHSFSAYNRAFNASEALAHYREWKQGFPNLLNHASNRRYVRVAAGGGSSALLLRLQAEGLFAGYGGSL